MSSESGDAPALWDAGQALDALGDATCRSILTETLGEQLTARELVDRCEESRSTVYRKLRTLVDNGFLARSNRIHMDAKDATQFETAIDSMRVDFTENGIELDCTPDDE